MGKNMSKDGFDHKTIMRVRTGPNQGDATERQMLDAIDDTGNFRTRLMLHPDGSTTRMKTKAGMPEFITDEVPPVEDETCTLKLDNGVVDLLSASFLGTTAGDHDDGILHRTSYVSQHIAASVADPATGPVDGTIHPPKFVGVSPDDNLAAASFKYLGEYPFGASAYDKKRMSVLCSPSIFTGKMRQYMQALYGRHDHAEILRLPDAPSMNGPSIYFDATKKFGDESNPTGAAVRFDTNCGIFTDQETCKHYLISVAGSTTTIYRMLATTCAEKLRKKLLDPAITLGTKIRVETYILSQSRPDTTPAQITTLSSPDLPQFSMGYGWHFNASGTACDMVVTDYFGYGENRSTHYRLSFAFDRSTGFWTLTPSVVEGPTDWKNYRHQHVIAYPSWDYAGLVKFGANSAVQPYGNAPFYAFYTNVGFSDTATGSLSATMNSELKVCRYSASTSTTPKGATRTPAYMNPGSLFVFGSDPCDYRRWEAHSTTNYVISCGDTQITARDEVVTKHINTHSGATMVWDSPGGYYSGDLESPLNYSVPNGDGVPDNCTKGWITDPYEGALYVCGQVETQQNAGPYDQVTGYVPNARFLGYGGMAISTWSTESLTSLENHNAVFIIVVPFDDAEALYMFSSQRHFATSNGWAQDHTGGTFFNNCHATRPYVGGPWTQIAGAGTLGSPNWSAAGTQIIDRDDTTAADNTYRIVGNYGTKTSVSIPSAGAFFNVTYDVIPVVVSHKSSALGIAAHSDDFGVNEGMPTVTLTGKPFTFVGWA